MKNFDALSLQTLRRLPGYHLFIQTLQRGGISSVSASTIAEKFGLNEVQVRKDIAAVSKTPGKPRTGFDTGALLDDIADCLGYNNVNDAVIAGIGKLGSALMSYSGFEAQGVRIIAGFDHSPELAGTRQGNTQIFSMDKMPDLCRRTSTHIGIITVPAPAAQEVCDLMVESGILAILNFAPAHLVAPPHVLVQNENLALSLTLLSQHVSENV